jgi:hypothetical protein
MSVEAQVITALCEEGSVKRAFQAGITEEDFTMHDEEFEWLVNRAEKRRPINARVFKQAFPEFEYIPTREKLTDLLDELKSEGAYLAVSAGIEEALVDLTQENAIEKASELREILGQAIRSHSPNSELMLKGNWQDHLAEVKRLSILREGGEIAGIPTGLPHLDLHWGGLQGQASYVFLGRPGDAKSFGLAKLTVEGAWAGYRMGFFSPEMTELQHRARFNTLLSAKKEVQEALGITQAFRNRPLREGRGFNLKTYKRFLQWIEDNLKGEIALFTQKYRREKMNVSYIESRIEELGLDAIIVDPIYKLKPPRRRGSRWEELSEITDALIDLAHAFNIPVIISNQANRALVGRRGEAPDKDSSFASDAPVQEADTVIGVKHFSEERQMAFRCSKNRHGEPFNFKAHFVPNIGILEDITPIQADAYYNGYDPEQVHVLSDAMKEMEAGITQ